MPPGRIYCSGCSLLTEKSGEQRHQGGTDESDTAASHELLHALRLCAGVIVAVALKQVDGSLDAQACAKGHNESLKYGYCRVKECHRYLPPN